MATVSMPQDAAESDALYEVVNGEIVENTPKGICQIRLAFRLAYFLESFLEQTGLGISLTEGLFDFTAQIGNKRRPDVAFVSKDRWPRNMPIPDTEAWDVVPDLAVEVISSTNSAREIVTKINEYFQVGVERVWVVYPSHRQFYVYTSPTELRILSDRDELVDEALFPGFRLPLSTLFDDTARG